MLPGGAYGTRAPHFQHKGLAKVNTPLVSSNVKPPANHPADMRHGTIVAGHRHAYTGVYFHYRAVYAPDGDQIDWLATVTFNGATVAELSGSQPCPIESVAAAVTNAVADAIDRRDFFDATGPGQLNV